MPEVDIFAVAAVAFILLAALEWVRHRKAPRRETPNERGLRIAIVLLVFNAILVWQAYSLEGRGTPMDREHLLWTALASYGWTLMFWMAATVPHRSFLLRWLSGSARLIAAACFAVGTIALVLLLGS
jgi:hypothetical protein